MSKQTKDLPNLVHHRATGRARFRHRGKDIYVGRWDTERDRPTAEAVEAAAYEWKRICDGTHPKFSSAKRSEVGTVRQAAMAYLEDLDARGKYRRVDGSPSPEREGIQRALKVMCKLHGSYPLKDYDTDLLMELQRAFIEPQQEGRTEKLSVSTVNKSISRVLRFVKWAELAKWAPRGTWASLSIVPHLEAGEYGCRDTADVDPVKPSELMAVLRWLRSDACTARDAIRTEVLLRVVLATGARISEILTLRWCDIVERDGQRFVEPRQHKNARRGDARIIWIPPHAWRLLERLRAEQRQLDAQAYIWHVKGNTRKCMTDNNARKRVLVALGHAGATDWGDNSDKRGLFHRLRHSRATQLERRYGGKVAGVLIGHRDAITEGNKSLKMTAHYVHAEVQRVVADLHLSRRLGA